MEVSYKKSGNTEKSRLRSDILIHRGLGRELYTKIFYLWIRVENLKEQSLQSCEQFFKVF